MNKINSISHHMRVTTSNKIIIIINQLNQMSISYCYFILKIIQIEPSFSTNIFLVICEKNIFWISYIFLLVAKLLTSFTWGRRHSYRLYNKQLTLS